MRSVKTGARSTLVRLKLPDRNKMYVGTKAEGTKHEVVSPKPKVKSRKTEVGNGS